ncbi:hypothetical protein R1sor_004203 [Riccia sorocarpa]|uniref:CBS domain-containing protein n=1 Tax=Riccia sorocarpa TaxID=122646 RepID=A0ABD3H5P8_9MARC
MHSRMLKRVVSDTDRGLLQKKDAVAQNFEDISNEGEQGIAQLRALRPTEALKAFFERIPLHSIPGIDNSGVIEVQAGQTIEEAMRLLYKEDVLGAPVVDVPLGTVVAGPVTDHYVGLIDLGSMILWSLEEFEVKEPQAQVRGLQVAEDRELSQETSDGRGVEGRAEEAEGVSKKENDDFWSLLSRLDDIGSSKVGALARSFRWGPFLPIYPEDSLLHILMLLSKHSLKAAPVVDPEDNKVTGFITQDAAMQLLLQCSGLPWFDSISQKQLSQFMFQADQPPGGLVYVYEDKPLIDALHSLWKYRVSAVPVLERESDRLVGCVRTADARILLEDYELFRARREITVKKFMKADPASKVNPAEQRHRTPVEERIGAAVSAAVLSLGSFTLPPMQDPVTSVSTDTLELTMKKLVAARSDRSFMLDDQRRLTGVITIRDIIIQFSPPLGEQPDRWGDLFENAL